MATRIDPPCPSCGTSKNVKAIGISGEMWHCCRCGGDFDNDPDEGGDYGNNPTKRIEWQENRQRSQREYMNRRMLDRARRGGL